MCRYCWIEPADNPTYYILDDDRSRYADYTGCGNTLNANHAVVRRMILDSLRYWVQEMHVDGFRFDLASVLSRDASGRPAPDPPIIWDIESDPVLAGTKLIAEAWDAAGLYQVGSFIGDSWKEWNGRYRDDVRAFFRCGVTIMHDDAERLSNLIQHLASAGWETKSLVYPEIREAAQSAKFPAEQVGAARISTAATASDNSGQIAS